MKIKYLGATCMALLLSIGMFSTTAYKITKSERSAITRFRI